MTWPQSTASVAAAQANRPAARAFQGSSNRKSAAASTARPSAAASSVQHRPWRIWYWRSAAADVLEASKELRFPWFGGREAHERSFHVRPPCGWRGNFPQEAGRPTSMPARARARHFASVRRQSVCALPGGGVRNRLRQLEAESAGELGRRAPLGFGFERVGVHDMNEPVRLDDARFPLGRWQYRGGSGSPRPGPTRRRSFDGAWADTSGRAASRPRRGRRPR